MDKYFFSVELCFKRRRFSKWSRWYICHSILKVIKLRITLVYLLIRCFYFFILYVYQNCWETSEIWVFSLKNVKEKTLFVKCCDDNVICDLLNYVLLFILKEEIRRSYFEACVRRSCIYVFYKDSYSCKVIFKTTFLLENIRWECVFEKC